MELNSKNGPTMMISGGDMGVPGGHKVYDAVGALNGTPVYALRLTVFGDADPVAFLLNLANELRKRQSPIVRPG